jgi:hypothetical protein
LDIDGRRHSAPATGLSASRRSCRFSARDFSSSLRTWSCVALFGFLVWMGDALCLAQVPVSREHSADQIALVRVDNALTVSEVDSKTVKTSRGNGNIQVLRLQPGPHALRLKMEVTHRTSASVLTETSKDLRLSIVVEAGHRYLLTCSNVDVALWAAELIDETEALRTVTPSASGAVPLALTVVVADMSFSISGGDIQQLIATEALLRRSAKGLKWSRQTDLAKFLERYAKEREAHEELASVAVVCPLIAGLDKKK